MRQAMWKMIVAAVAVMAASVSANSIVGVSYPRDQFEVGVSHGYGHEELAVASVNLSTNSRQIEEARVQARPIFWDDQPGLMIVMTFYGRHDQDPTKAKKWLSSVQAFPGVELGSSIGGWDDQGKVVDQAFAWAEIEGLSWSNTWINYETFPYGKGSLNQPRGFQWTFGFTGYFDDPVKGRATLAALPEPSALVLLGIGALPFLLRRR